MCSYSNAIIRESWVKAYWGYNGGWIKIDDIKYCQDDETDQTKTEMINKLSEYGKSELVGLIIDLTKNSEEL